MGSESLLSFEPASHPGRYLRHRDFKLHLDDKKEGEDKDFCGDATWHYMIDGWDLGRDEMKEENLIGHEFWKQYMS